jgi:hypothetical protein
VTNCTSISKDDVNYEELSVCKDVILNSSHWQLHT